MKNDCLFCGIVDGEVPCHKIFEDDECLAFLDISGDVEGHTLVVPKQHCENILDCPQNLFCKVMGVAQKIARHYVENCGYAGANIAINNGKPAEQQILHLHVHVIPRKKDDKFSVYANLPNVERDFENLCKKLKI